MSFLITKLGSRLCTAQLLAFGGAYLTLSGDYELDARVNDLLLIAGACTDLRRRYPKIGRVSLRAKPARELRVKITHL